MAHRKPTERTNKFLEVTDPKRAVGLWSYYAVRETAMTPVGNTKEALGRFLNGDIVRWEHRGEMAEALTAKGVGLTGGKSPARAVEEYIAEADADKNKLSVAEWREKYAWLLAWSRYTCRLAAPNAAAVEKDVQMFFNAPSAGMRCHEGNLHSGRLFFLRTKVKGDLNADRVGGFRTQSPSANAKLGETCAATTPPPDGVGYAATTFRPVAPDAQNAGKAFSDCGVGATDDENSNRAVVATSENASSCVSRSDLRSKGVQKSQYRYFVAVVLKPGGTKWWSQIDHTNVTWTDNVYDRLIIDPRGSLSWSPILAEVINEQVSEKNICLFQLADDALFKAITDNELNPNEKYAHLCYDFDFFYRQGEAGCLVPGAWCRGAETAPSTKHQAPSTSFYLRWAAFFNPKKGKFDAAQKSKPRVIEICGERKKGWTTRRFEVRDEFSSVSSDEPQALRYANGKRKPVALSRDDAKTVATSDAKLGLGNTPLDNYAQGVARWVAENNGCAVLPIGVSREMRLALSHALYFVTFPDRRPDEPGGILRGYQLPGRLVEHAPGKVRSDNSKVFREYVQKQSEEATARRRKMIVDCLFDRACAAVLSRNNGSVLERRSQGGFGTQSPSANAELGETCAATTPPPDGVGYAATTFRTTHSDPDGAALRPVDTVAPDAQNAGKAFSDCGVGATDDDNSTRAVVATSENASSCVSRSDLRSKGVLKITEKTIVPIMESIGARVTLEKAAWKRNFMEGQPLKLFKPGPTAGNLKLPDLSLALAFENRLGLKGETASATDLLVQTAPIRSLKESQGAIRVTLAGAYPCRSMWTPSPGKEKGLVAYPSDAVRILRDEGRYYLLAHPKYAQYKSERDLAFEPDLPGKKKTNSVPVAAYSFKSVGGVRSRANSYVVEETFDVNKVMRLARDGRIYLYSIDFGKDKWLADIVFSSENKQPCKIVPTIPILAPEGIEKKNALDDGRKNGTDIETKVAVTSETAQVFIAFTFNPTVARDNRKVEGRSWKSYCDAFPAEAQRTVVRWPSAEVPGAWCLVPGLDEALQKVIETDGVLLTDKEHLDEALRAATYVVPAPNPQSPIPIKGTI